ncbi:LOW QUALITY PROTEIN: hypothetical protein M8C21_000898, partial [Ambrosia artemisiifolia]
GCKEECFDSGGGFTAARMNEVGGVNRWHVGAVTVVVAYIEAATGDGSGVVLCPGKDHCKEELNSTTSHANEMVESLRYMACFA